MILARRRPVKRRIAEALGVNDAVATRDIRRLEESVLLREITGHAQNRVYRADEAVEAIAEPLGQEGEPYPRD